MPISRPTLQELIERSRADIEARIPGADAHRGNSVLGSLARVHAGGMHGLYGFLVWIAKQIIPDTADAEYLERWASLWGVARLQPVAATGNLTITGTNGISVPAGTEFQTSDGIPYTVNAEVTVASGTATAAITAVTGGSTGNQVAGTNLTLATPIPGITSQATVASGGLTGGTDAEPDDSLRQRLVERVQTPPHGGRAEDYIAWAKEVSGVTRAWVYPQELGIGTVTVRFTRDDDASIIPDSAEVAAVQAYIDALRPVTADVTVVAPVAVPLNFTIQLTPGTQAVKDAVTAEIGDLLAREAEPGGTILISHIREAISIAAGETNHVLVVPAADVTHATGQIATMGTITWA